MCCEAKVAGEVFEAAAAMVSIQLLCKTHLGIGSMNISGILLDPKMLYIQPYCTHHLFDVRELPLAQKLNLALCWSRDSLSAC